MAYGMRTREILEAADGGRLSALRTRFGAADVDAAVRQGWIAVTGRGRMAKIYLTDAGAHRLSDFQ